MGKSTLCTTRGTVFPWGQAIQGGNWGPSIHNSSPADQANIGGTGNQAQRFLLGPYGTRSQYGSSQQ
eukprot:7767663-Karenia_brevis.AAC.1